MNANAWITASLALTLLGPATTLADAGSGLTCQRCAVVERIDESAPGRGNALIDGLVTGLWGQSQALSSERGAASDHALDQLSSSNSTQRLPSPRYEVHLRLADGQHRIVQQAEMPPLQIGQQVDLIDGRIANR